MKSTAPYRYSECSAPILRATTTDATRKPADPAQQLLRDVGAVGGIARKALARVEGGVVQQLLPPERERLRRAAAGARHDVEDLIGAITKEVPHAG